MEFVLAWMRNRKELLIVIGAYLILASLFATNIPIYEAPDEPGHFDQILHMITTRSLPVQSVEHRNYAHHPPLYYILAALPAAVSDVNDVSSMPTLRPDFKWPSFDSPAVAVHYTAETFPYSGRVLGYFMARSVSVLSGAATLTFAILIGQKLFPKRPETTWFATVLILFNPQFLFVNSTITNDSLLITTCTGVIYQILLAFEKPENLWRWVWLGVWCAAAILTKSLAIAVLGVAGVCWLIAAIHKRSVSFFIKSGLAAGLPIALLAGWWFVRNQLLYGDIFGWQVYQQAWAINLRSSPLRWHHMPTILETQYRSFWGVFGWMNVYAPDRFYQLIAVLLVTAVLGLVWAFVSGRMGELSPSQKRAFAVFCSYAVLLEAFVIYQNSVHNSTLSQGRFLLPAVVPLAFFVAFGLLALVPDRAQRPLAAGLILLLLALPIYTLLAVVRPAYPTIPRPKQSIYMLPKRTDFVFGDMFALRGYDWDIEESDRPGISVVDLELNWQAVQPPDFDYSVFVHVLNSADEIVFQLDQAPGVGHSYLPTGWRAGDIVADRWRLEVPEPLLDEGVRLRIGVYNWITGERLAEVNRGEFVILEID